MRFLIVDDDTNGRRIMEMFLRKYGDYVSAGKGEDALDAYAKATFDGNPFDLVYLDMVMPGIDGIQTLTALRNYEAQHGIAKAVPVVMLTGESDITRINMAKSLGIAEYLLKPVPLGRLLQGIEKLGLLRTDTSW